MLDSCATFIAEQKSLMLLIFKLDAVFLAPFDGNLLYLWWTFGAY